MHHSVGSVLGRGIGWQNVEWSEMDNNGNSHKEWKYGNVIVMTAEVLETIQGESMSSITVEDFVNICDAGVGYNSGRSSK